MSNSPNLALPYILPAQAQKHVTHNLAIERLDALVQLNLTDLAAAAPPADPFEGQVVAVGDGAGGAFTGHDGDLAYRTNGAWMFVPPRNGFKAWVESRGAFYVHRDGTWQRLLAVGDDSADGLGINTAWDAGNRLAVSSPGTLLTHEGAGHRLKVNKAAAGDTASLVFQTGFSGRAEIGLAGGDDVTVKVSPDGQTWTTALSVGAATGAVEAPVLRTAEVTGDAVQADPADTTPGRLMRADWGYGPGNLVGPVSQTGGQPTGAVVERGETADGSYTRWADGTQACWREIDFDTDSIALQSFAMPAGFAPGSVVAAGVTLRTEDMAGSGYGNRIEAFNKIAIGAAPDGWSARILSSLDIGTVTLVVHAMGRWI